MRLTQSDLSRILIFGGSGSGKTTLATQLGAITNHPVTHIDDIFWLENWHELSDDLLRAEIDGIVKTNHWIIDGNYSRNQDLTIPRSTLIIILRLHPLITVSRLIKRTLGRTKLFNFKCTPLPKNIVNEGNLLETIFVLSKHSIKFYYKKINALDRIGDKKTLILYSPKQVKDFLRLVEDAKRPVE